MEIFHFCVAGASLLMRGEKPHLFLLGHSHGTDWVEYNVEGWLSHAKHNPAAQNATTLLQDSHKYDHQQQTYNTTSSLELSLLSLKICAICLWRFSVIQYMAFSAVAIKLHFWE